jgi:hypothetical protein
MIKLRSARFVEAAELAGQSLHKFRSLDLSLSTTADLTTIAASLLGLQREREALFYITEAIKTLDLCRGEGPDYPHRDYWLCAQTLQTLGEVSLAKHALESAYRLLLRQAHKISNLSMRQSYLDNIAYNREILQAAKQAGLAE